MIVPGNNMSDESEDELDTSLADPYRRKYQLISERCEVLQQDNERLVYRIQQVRKELRRTKRERKFILERLDGRGDGWRDVPLPLPVDELVRVKTEKPTTSKTPSTSKAGVEKGKKTNGTTKRKTAPKERIERDKNAPKRPPNPFFQYCQQERPKMIERLKGELKDGETEPTKQELTKRLANQWNLLNPDEKKVFYQRYELSKEEYNVALSNYKRDRPPTSELNAKPAESTTSATTVQLST